MLAECGIHDVMNPVLYLKKSSHDTLMRIRGGGTSVSSDSETVGGDSNDDESDEEEESSWLKHVPENPEDDPEFMRNFEELSQAIIDSGNCPYYACIYIMQIPSGLVFEDLKMISSLHS